MSVPHSQTQDEMEGHGRNDRERDIILSARDVTVAFGTKVAYPWYALVGSSTVVIVGLISSALVPAEPAREVDLYGVALNHHKGHRGHGCGLFSRCPLCPQW